MGVVFQSKKYGLLVAEKLVPSLVYSLTPGSLRERLPEERCGPQLNWATFLSPTPVSMGISNPAIDIGKDISPQSNLEAPRSNIPSESRIN